MNYTKDEATVKDELNRKIYVDSLTEMALTCETPMVIGIHGQWGMGKTSMMYQIRDQLDKKHESEAKTVWFSPWEYQYESSPVLPLLHTIREEFGLTGKSEKKGMKLLNILSTLGGELLLTALTGGKISIKDVIGLGKNYEKKYFEVKTLSKRLKSAYEADIKSLLEEPTTNLLEETATSLSEEPTTRLLEQAPKRLIMFIDDLDRCQPEICLRMLESLKLFLNVERCVYFMGLDNRIIESIMEKKYPDKEINGKDYLQKIIQVPFQIPLIDDETIGSYISALSTDPCEEFKSLQSIFITCVGRNPRQVKRFLNTFRLNDILARQILQDNYEKEILIKLLGIQFEDTTLYGFLAEHSRRLLDMEKFFQDEEIVEEESRTFCEEYSGNERITNIFTIGKQFREVEEDVLEKYFTLTALTLGEEERQKELIAKARGKKPARPFKFPFSSSLHNQTSSEENFVGREDVLDTITQWYKNPDVRIGSLIGLGGIGKSVLVRKWYDDLGANNIQPDGILWWGFYHNASLEQFLNALLRYVSGGQVEPETIQGTWEKTNRIKEYLGLGAYLIVLDGFEQMQNAETGSGFGRMIHRELTSLLHYLVDVPKAGGMFLITSRFPLKDLDDWENRGYESLGLGDLNITEALSMLKKRGVKGSDEEMTEVVNRYKGHALSLTSLAGYLVRYYGGDIKEAPSIEFVLGDKRRFRDVNNLLQRYAEKISEAERVFLNIFSLFRQDVTKDNFDNVFREKIEGSTCNDVLVKMSDLDFRDLVGGLVDLRLISYDETKKTYSTHPLIKAYFESDFESQDKKLCHKRIYEYIGEYVPEEADTLEEMQPLFEQVYYGCAAGLYDDVLVDVYWEKIYRGNEDFITQKLGAWETALSIVKNFFPESDLSQMPLVSKKNDQGWLINEAGLALLNTGRPQEAEKTFLTGIKVAVQDNNEIIASASHQNLSELQFRTGELETGRISAEKALAAAEKAESDKYIVNSKAYLGWILYMLGKTEEVEQHFEMADKIEIRISGHRDYSITGVFYADFLISMKRINEAFELTKQNLEICQRHNWTNDISRCHRCLGSIERTIGNYKEAENHLQNALEIARKVGMPFLEIEALLEHGMLCLDIGRHEDAIGDAHNVLEICGRTGFRLYEPGAEIVLAKAYLEKKVFEKAETFANSAYAKAVKMKYRWAEGDAADLLGQIFSVSGDKTKERKWLKQAVGCRNEILDSRVEETEGKLKKSKIKMKKSKMDSFTEMTTVD